MKLNPKVYANLTGEPIEVQDLGAVKCELHAMNDTPYYDQFTSKARFAVWATQGGDYKLLVEKDYYDTMKDLYSKRVNKVWIDFYSEVDRIRRRSTTHVFLPLLLLYLVAAIVIPVVFGEASNSGIFFGLLGIALFISIFNNRMMTKKIRNKNYEAVNEIKRILGEKRFDQLIEQQRDYTEKFFGVDQEHDDNDEQDIVLDADIIEADETDDAEDLKKEDEKNV